MWLTSFTKRTDYFFLPKHVGKLIHIFQYKPFELKLQVVIFSMPLILNLVFYYNMVITSFVERCHLSYKLMGLNRWYDRINAISWIFMNIRSYVINSHTDCTRRVRSTLMPFKFQTADFTSKCTYAHLENWRVMDIAWLRLLCNSLTNQVKAW